MKLKIGENIRQYRRESNMTQQQFAEKLGVSYQSVSRWENEETYPDMELLPSIAGFLNITVDKLMGVPDIEKEKMAHEAFDALRRASLKEHIDADEVISLLREIRREYLNASEAWRPWCEGNDRCFGMPDILPEVRLTAEAYLALHPMAPHVLQTMAYIEDEEHLGAFLDKYTTVIDTSQRSLLYTRYLRKRDGEKLEPERRYKFYEAANTLLWPCVLQGLDADDERQDAATLFRIRLLGIILDGDCDDAAPDMWTEYRIELGIRYASILARNGQVKEAMERLETAAALLKNTMKITATQPLGTSCRWLSGMIWNAEETWFQKGNDPDVYEERAIYIYTSMNGMRTCCRIFPSTYYDNIANLKGKEILQSLPEYQDILTRIKAWIEKRPKAQ